MAGTDRKRIWKRSAPLWVILILFLFIGCNGNLSDSEKAEKLINGAKTKTKLRDFRGALRNLDEAESLQPDNADLYITRSMVHYNNKSYRKCIKDCTKALKLINSKDEKYHDTSTTVLVRRGAALMNLGSYKTAISDLTRVIEKRPDFAFAYYDRGRCYVKLGYYKDARADFNRVLELKPEADIESRTRKFLKEIE